MSVTKGHRHNVKTDYTKWRLRDERGAQTWHYLTNEQAKDWPQTAADKYHLGLPTVRTRSMAFGSNVLAH